MTARTKRAFTRTRHEAPIRCDEISKASIHGMNLECDLCGEIASYKELHRDDDLVYLCSHCFTRLEALSEGEIKESIRRFLTRNVI